MSDASRDASRMYSLLIDPRFKDRPRTRGLMLGMLVERLKPHSTAPTKTDTTKSAVHLLDDACHNLAHALQHAKRLEDDDIKSSPEAMQWHNSHTTHHLTEGLNDVQRAVQWLSENASDPKVFASESETLQGIEQDVDTDDGDDEKSAPAWFLEPRTAA